MANKGAIIGIVAVLLVAAAVGVVVGVTLNRKDDKKPEGGAQVATSTKAVKQICAPTDYQQSCEQALADVNSADPKTLVKAAFNATVKHLKEAINNSSLVQEAAKDIKVKDALENCRELLEFSINDLMKSFDNVESFELTKVSEILADIKTWLSGAITYQQTCLDGFEGVSSEAGQKMKKYLELSGQLTSNGLAMVTEFEKTMSGFQLPSSSRRLLSEDGFPEWLGNGRRKLLQAHPAELKPNVVVAQDGSGKYKTVSEALKEVPKDNKVPFVIYVKAGVYNEYVNITKKMANVYLIGDGPTKTKITGNRSFGGGVNTYRTATVCADGEHFMAKNIGFENSAGGHMHQAVALRVSSDRSIIYNCQIDGYQDTLYCHTHRQFYRDCIISGTVDFIFGDAAAVFQNCKMVIRKPLPNQSNMVTAQGRTDKRATTGIVMQNCTVTGSEDYMPVKAQFKSYLGRPWKNYSRTVIMQSQIDDVIDPTGWAPWQGTVHLDTLWYAEVLNRGPGSNTNGRVKWAGIQNINPQAAGGVAAEFVPQKFIGGDAWIPATGVPYTPGMIKV